MSVIVRSQSVVIIPSNDIQEQSSMIQPFLLMSEKLHSHVCIGLGIGIELGMAIMKHVNE